MSARIWQRVMVLALLSTSVVLLAAAPARPFTSADFRDAWGCPTYQDPAGTVDPACVCPGVSHDGLLDSDLTWYDRGVFLQLDPGFDGSVHAEVRVANATCECGTQPGYGRCIATCRVEVHVAVGTVVCLDHAGGVRWNCHPDNDCAPRHQCCLTSRSGVGDDPLVSLELVENTLCGSSETAVFPVSRALVGPGCSVPPGFRIADVRFHWRCGACAPEASADSGG